MKPQSSMSGRWAWILCLGAAVLAPGCAAPRPMVPTLNKWGTAAEPPTETEQPTKLVAIWSDNVLQQPGAPPMRGLGGRLYFYNNHETAVAVDGELIVYGYEDDDQADADSEFVDVPAKKFVFTQDQLVKHYSPSEFGPSYSFWLPWDSELDSMKSVSVVPVFVDAQGKVVMGQHVRHRLPGKEDPALASKNGAKSKSSTGKDEKAWDSSAPEEDKATGTLANRRLEAKSIPLRGMSPQLLASLKQTVADSQVVTASGQSDANRDALVRAAGGASAEANGTANQNGVTTAGAHTSSAAGDNHFGSLGAIGRNLARPRIMPPPEVRRNNKIMTAATAPSTGTTPELPVNTASASASALGGGASAIGGATSAIGGATSAIGGATSALGGGVVRTPALPGSGQVSAGEAAASVIDGQPMATTVRLGKPGDPIRRAQ